MPRPVRDSRLSALLEHLTKISSATTFGDICREACQIAVELIGADRSTFVLFDESLISGRILAEYCSDSLPREYKTIDDELTIPLVGVPEEERLLQQKQVIRCSQVEALTDGVFKTNLLKRGVKSVLIVPVISVSRIWGSFSLDSVAQHREFSTEAEELSRMLSSQIVNAMNNFEAQYKSTLLARLDDCLTSLRGVEGDVKSRATLVELALRLCEWKDSALYQYSKDSNELRYIAGNGGNLPRVSFTSDEVPWMWRCLDSDTHYVIYNEGTHAQLFKDDGVLSNYRTVAGLKVVCFDNVDSLLLIADDDPHRMFSKVEVDYLHRFVCRATEVFERLDLWESVWERLNLEFLHLLGPGPTNEREFGQLLHVFLTMLTARFGLKFNRAMLFTLSEDRTHLLPRMGIGHFNRSLWEEDCARGADNHTNELQGWLPSAKLWDPTPLEEMLRGELPIPLSFNSKTAFEEVLETCREVLLPIERITDLPGRILTMLSPTRPVLIAPLYTGAEVLGLVLVDKEFTGHQISSRDVLLLNIFCKQVAISISSFMRPSRLVGSLDALFQEINHQVTEAEFQGGQQDALLQRILESSQKAFHASSVALCITDSRGNRTSRGAKLDFSASTRANSIGGRVLRTGIVEIAEDLRSDGCDFDEGLRKLGAKAVICLPFFLQRRVIGVMWILYSSRVGWSRWDHASLQRFSTEVSLLYENWLGVNSLARQRRTMREIANAESFGEACRILVRQVKKIFGARTATLWPYDVRKRAFIVDGVQHVGFKERLPAPTPNGITYRLLHSQDVLSIEDINDPAVFTNVGALTRKFLQRNDVIGVQGIAVYAGDEPIAVLYVGYGESQRFGFERLRLLADFARDAAIVLRAARQKDAQRHAIKAASAMSNALTLGNLRDVLEAISRDTFHALRCDSLMIFEYDEQRQYLTLSPMEGYNTRVCTPMVLLLSKVFGPEDEIVAINETRRQQFEVLLPDAKEFGVIIAVRLRYAGRVVGMISVLFRAELQDREIDTVLELVRLIANHASVAIGTAARLNALGKLSTELLGCESPKFIQQSAVATVVNELRPDYCSLVFKEGMHLRCVAQHNWGPEVFTEIVEPGGDSHAGFVIQRRKPAIFYRREEIQSNPELKGLNLPTRVMIANIVSGIGVPIEEDGEIKGAMLAHTITPRRFTAEDVGFLSLVANELMIAYRSARRLVRSEAHYEAARWIAQMSPSEQRESVIESLLNLVWKNIKDEGENSKLAFASIEIGGDYKFVRSRGEPTTSRFRSVPIHNAGDDLGTLSLQTLPNRELDNEDNDILVGIASLIGLALVQCEQHSVSRSRMAEVIAEVDNEVKRVRETLSRQLSTRATEESSARQTILLGAVERCSRVIEVIQSVSFRKQSSSIQF